MALIEVRNLVKRYGDRTVLDHVDLDVPEGAVTVVMGPSGSGKSTLLRCLNRLVEPSSGSIRFRGEEVTGPQTDVRALRQGMGFVFQNFALYRHLSVQDNVTLALRKLRGLSRRQADERARHELERLDLGAQRDKYPSELSGGQKQRAAIARALAMDPAVLLLDEPTSALDPVLTRDVVALINRLYLDNVTMLCVTHDLFLARFISDKVVFLADGRVQAQDSIENLAQRTDDPRLQDFFGRGRQA
ncbi:MAG: amino acid ABC transporter ATP-binding protein [Burkholderiaceae bacterium]